MVGGIADRHTTDDNDFANDFDGEEKYSSDSSLLGFSLTTCEVAYDSRLNSAEKLKTPAPFLRLTNQIIQCT